MTGIERHEIERRLERIEETVDSILLTQTKNFIATRGRPSRILHIVRHLEHPTATSISFKEITMLPTTGGNTLIYTGTLSPVGSVLAPDFVATVSSNDLAVLPTVDATGLIVTVPLPAGWVESTTTPLAITYATTSASTGQALSATITPSAPVVLATSIAFVQTT